MRCITRRKLAIVSLTMLACSSQGPSTQSTGGGGPGSGGGGSTSTASGSSGAGGQSGATSGGSSGTVSGGGKGGTSAGTSTGGTTTSGTLACVPGVPATSQVPRMKGIAYDNVVRDLLGLTGLSNNGNQPPSSMLAPDSDGALTDIAWNGYLSAAAEIAAEVMAGSNKSKFLTCDPTTNTTTCLTNIVKTFGRKAFRRPLTSTEVTSFMRLASLAPAGKPAEVAEAILYAFLASPSFILLPELAQDKDSSGSLKLNSYEVATRLSFLLWSSVPDDTLGSAADAGQLATKDQIGAQAQRMLKSDKAKAVVTNFVHHYVGIETGSHWSNNNSHDSTKYPSFTDASYAPALAEIDAFFQDVVLGGGKFKDLFLGNNGFVTKDTAALYGLSPSSYGTQPTKVQLDSKQRPGFLTRVGFLSTFSKYDVTSPILRGAFISGRVLGVNPGTPDPAFINMTPPAANYTTQRQAVEALTANEPCRSCHGVNINPSGFVLEHYNSVGSWQDKDPLGGAIDGTADVRFSATRTKTIDSPLALMTEIGNLPEAKHLLAQQWVAFATGRVANPNDACVVDQLSTNMASESYPVLSVISDYTQADSFRLRTVGN